MSADRPPAATTRRHSTAPSKTESATKPHPEAAPPNNYDANSSSSVSSPACSPNPSRSSETARTFARLRTEVCPDSFINIASKHHPRGMDQPGVPQLVSVHGPLSKTAVRSPVQLRSAPIRQPGPAPSTDRHQRPPTAAACGRREAAARCGGRPAAAATTWPCRSATRWPPAHPLRVTTARRLPVSRSETPSINTSSVRPRIRGACATTPDPAVAHPNSESRRHGPGSKPWWYPTARVSPATAPADHRPANLAHSRRSPKPTPTPEWKPPAARRGSRSCPCSTLPRPIRSKDTPQHQREPSSPDCRRRPRAHTRQRRHRPRRAAPRPRRSGS